MSDAYQIIYTESAVRDMEEKVDYISLSLQDPDLAETWYFRLKSGIIENLTKFPYKYPLYYMERWSAKGVRQFMFRNDVVLYSVDEEKGIVYIWAICTKGKDISLHLDGCI